MTTSKQRLRVCVAGTTGWMGRPISEAVLAAEDMELVSGVARGAAGRDLGEAWGMGPLGVPVHATVAQALDEAGARVDVLIDYTSHEAIRDNVLAALERKVAVVIGSSGLSADDFGVIDAMARRQEAGVIAAGNFSVTAAMTQAAAVLVAPYLPNCEIIDYASDTKPDAPSGTSRELAEKLAAVRPTARPLAQRQVGGQREALGATVAGTQVHSIRLPSFVVSTEVVFALTDERLSIRHDAGPTPEPYVGGTLLAARAVANRIGLTRGLGTLLLSEGQARIETVLSRPKTRMKGKQH